MKIKKVVLLTLLMTTSFVFSQTKLKFTFSIDKNQQETVIKVVEKDLGKPKELKKKEVLWFEKTKNYEYQVLVKKRKVTFVYKGTDTLVENKIRVLYLKTNNLK
jgi:hypothetical protein